MSQRLLLSPAELRAEFERRQPWITMYRFGGETYGGSFDYSVDPRLAQFARHVHPRARVLELGALEGGHTFMLATTPGVREVIAIEGRAENIEKAEFIRGVNGIENVRFIQADIRTLDLSQFANIDAIFCSGVLYHLPEPWRLISQCPKIAPEIFIWTHYCPDESASETINGYRVVRFNEIDTAVPQAGLQPESLWLTLGGLVTLLMTAGYDQVRILELQRLPAGPAVLMTASR